MANVEHLTLPQQEIVTWNEWREENKASFADLSGANLSEANLGGAKLMLASLDEASVDDEDAERDEQERQEQRRQNQDLSLLASSAGPFHGALLR